MSLDVRAAAAATADFIVNATVPPAARERAADAYRDTLGVILAGVGEPAARIAQSLAAEEGPGPCQILGTPLTAGVEYAALANGVAAHALDYDDMCFVSLAHPSCALVPAALATGELVRAPFSVLLDAYAAGFELECRLGTVMNPRHYHQRGWHCTSSIGTLGAAAAAARVLGLDVPATQHALGIAASAACGVKENIGSMVKPLHAGLAARHGVMAARLARRGLTASERALDGPQGYLAAMDSEHPSLAEAASDLGSRWEILQTGITVKLYPSCAATHPPLDVLLALQRRHGFTAEDVEAIDVEVDSMTPRLLIHPQPETGLEAKFSMPFCAAAAIVHGRLGIDTFAAEHIRNPVVQSVMRRVTLRANAAFDAAPPLSRTCVTVRLRDGRTLMQAGDGARGYPGRITEAELAAKFRDCAGRAMTTASADRAWSMVQNIAAVTDTQQLTALLVTGS